MAKSIQMAPLLAVFAALSAAGAVEAPVWSEDFPDPTTWRAPDGTWYASSTTLKIILPHHCHVLGDNPKARPLFVTELTWNADGWPTAR